jgi:hypothetical protein
VPRGAEEEQIRPSRVLAWPVVSEHVFPSGDWLADDALATTLVADLAELILDEISRPAHDWPALSRRTRDLDSVASAMAARYPGADGDDANR